MKYGLMVGNIRTEVPSLAVKPLHPSNGRLSSVSSSLHGDCGDVFLPSVSDTCSPSSCHDSQYFAMCLYYPLVHTPSLSPSSLGSRVMLH
ncbi:unnamed protein product [Ilex paraguariensis]|uniref:Uncharacterized protein n=1 Tax=Ilex paraguariensis TaxID=185542 RepID=A0ABC8S2N2_9AQUA